MKRTHVLSAAAASLLLMAATWAPRVLIKVVDANGDAVPNAYVEVYDEAGVFIASDFANMGGVARLDLQTESTVVLVKAESADGTLVGETTADLWKKGKAMNVVRVVVEEPTSGGGDGGSSEVPTAATAMALGSSFNGEVTIILDPGDEFEFQAGDVLILAPSGTPLTSVTFDNGDQAWGYAPMSSFFVDTQVAVQDAAGNVRFYIPLMWF